MSQALYLKWRPQTFDEVVGQQHVTSTLRNAIATGRIGHAYLLAGPRGTGKTTTARLLAKAVNCLDEDPAIRPCNQCAYCVSVNQGRFLDLIEIDAASHTGVDDVRDLRDRIAFAPNEGQYKVYIIDEVHRFSGAAFDALLKTIEEPPDHAIFVLATTEIHKVPQTILSRCQRFDFRRIALSLIAEHLQILADGEGVVVEEAAIALIARQGTGSLRDSISLLDQLITLPGEAVTLDMTQALLGTVANEAVQNLVDALINGDSATGLELINRVIEEGGDARQFTAQTVSYLRTLMIVQAGSTALVEVELTPDALAVAQEQANLLPRATLLKALDAFNTATSPTARSWQPQLPLELALLESIDHLHAAPVAVTEAPRSAARAPRAQAPAESDQAQAGDDLPPPAASAADMPTIQIIHQRWREVMAATRQLDPTCEALLNSGRIYGIEGHNLIFQMPSDILCAKIEQDQNRAFIEQALHHIFGVSIKISCRVGSGQSAGADEAIEDLIAQDSVTAYAVNELGGEVTNIEDSRSD